MPQRCQRRAGLATGLSTDPAHTLYDTPWITAEPPFHARQARQNGANVIRDDIDALAKPLDRVRLLDVVGRVQVVPILEAGQAVQPVERDPVPAGALRAVERLLDPRQQAVEVEVLARRASSRRRCSPSPSAPSRRPESAAARPGSAAHRRTWPRRRRRCAGASPGSRRCRSARARRPRGRAGACAARPRAGPRRHRRSHRPR